MNQTPDEKQVPPELVRRYTIVFIISTLFGMLMVFLSVAGRRQALIDAEKAKREAAAAEAEMSGDTSASVPAASVPATVTVPSHVEPAKP